ncbi:MAG TPA: CDP-alcohol phosphatidyltransferase family protein [Nocardioides sp.]|uniref:CDP-alcohol phosphatidyltransferase family protein n=1 Tax=Nocardioides sp. TaxID=35761 RepID=UPI002E3690AF|nr:CDP-alcohol phosphatidyltransferase family protein [Nocardioides sp.]HEX3930371.1 CDP-alcohol phosphatidyltransferase family protein [Nocardioides sp.]
MTVLPAVAALLLVLTLSPGLHEQAVLVGAAVAVATWLLVSHGVRRDGLARLGPANAVTLTRAVLTAGIAALVVQSWGTAVPRTLVVALAAVALATDLVDGRLARRTDGVSRFGASFDMETDAFLILVLSVYAVPVVGAWVLLIGLARYLLMLAGAAWPWLTAPTPPRRWAKFVAAVQGVVLAVVGADVLPRTLSGALALVALALLAESFGHQVLALWVRRREREVTRSRVVRRAVDAVALLLVWVALMVPRRPDHLSWGALLGIPLELLVFVALAVVLPRRWGRVLAIAGGGLLTVTVILTGLDLGFYEAFDRPFDPLTDPDYLGSALDLVNRSAGHLGQVLAVGGALLVVAGALALSVWAALRLRRAAHGAPRLWSRGVVALAVVWVVAGIGGSQLSGTTLAAAPASSLVHSQVDQIQAELRDRAVFRHALAHDPYADTPGSRLLRGLRGKDVLLVFVESYGRVAVDGSWFAPMVDQTLAAATGQLATAGFQARSGWLRSPTFGGISWLAHSTLQTGLWIDSQQRYDQVANGTRFNLTQAFRRAGWRTVSDIPSDDGPWEQGKRLYGFAKMYNSHNVGYTGPRFSYARIPDQYTFRAFTRNELDRPGRRPLMAEIDLVSSHTPWTPLPRLMPWSSLGNGSVYDGMAPAHTSILQLLGGADQQRNYAHSIQYSLESLVSFVQHSHDKKLVMVVLGDHQPNSNVSGVGVSHDVPISLVAHDPAVLRQISGWGWTPGLRPSNDGAVLPMNDFRDRFLSAFGSNPGPG